MSPIPHGSSLRPTRTRTPGPIQRGAHPHPEGGAQPGGDGGVALSGYLEPCGGATLVGLWVSRRRDVGPSSSGAPSPSAGSCLARSWGWALSSLERGAELVRSQRWPRGHQTPPGPLAAPCWTDLAWGGLSRPRCAFQTRGLVLSHGSTGLGAALPARPRQARPALCTRAHSDIPAQQAEAPRLGPSDTLNQGWSTHACGPTQLKTLRNQTGTSAPPGRQARQHTELPAEGASGLRRWAQARWSGACRCSVRPSRPSGTTLLRHPRQPR